MISEALDKSKTTVELKQVFGMVIWRVRLNKKRSVLILSSREN